MPSNLTHHTFRQGYQDIVNEKIASAIAKIEEAGLTPEACEKFLKTYGKVIASWNKTLLPKYRIAKTIILFLPLQVLHSNHAHMLDIKYSYLNILGHSEGCATSFWGATWFASHFQVHYVPDDRCAAADEREPGQELPWDCQENSPWHFQAEGGTQDETKVRMTLFGPGNSFVRAVP